MQTPLSNNSSEPTNTSMLYDDALPAALKWQGLVQASSTTPKLHLDADDEALSPYIIHLERAHQQASSAQSDDQQDPIAQLASTLIIEPSDDIECDEASDHDVLELDFEHIAAQLQEPDIDFPTVQANSVRIEEPAKPSAATLVPLETDIPETLIDLFEGIENTSSAQPEEADSVTVQIEHIAEEILEETEEFIDTVEADAEQWSISFFAGYKRSLAAFVALSFALVLPLQAMQGISSMHVIQADIEQAGSAAVEQIARATSALSQERFDIAQQDFGRAALQFNEAEEALHGMHGAIATVVNVIPQTDRTYDSVRGLIQAGSSYSLAAQSLAQASAELSDDASTDLVTKLRLFTAYLENALPLLEDAQNGLDEVNLAIIPDDYQEQVQQLQIATPQLVASVEEFLTFSDALATILGGDRKMRYLLAFQNNTELRATGGFIGSFAEVDIEDGQIVQIHIPPGGTYDVQGQLSAFVESPEPLSLINPRWEFHDANWFPDFPSSAEKLLWFYQKAGGPTVDGVIALNATIIPDLLELLGPVDMPEYDRQITAENFLFETQKIVELEYDEFVNPELEREEDAPKQFIGDLAPILLERLTEADASTLIQATALLGDSLIEKDVQVYFENQTLQAQMQDLGFTGEIKQTDGDYLMVVNTNIGGQKTDLVIDQHIDLYSDVQEDGSIINTVTITKTHNGIENALFDGVNNVDYLRLYVPEGSELLSASGFEIPDSALFEDSEHVLYPDEDLSLIMHDIEQGPGETDIWTESGKTVFGNWIQTKPGETEIIEFTYRLPFTIALASQEQTLLDAAKERIGFKDLTTHTLLVQKQPGVLTREMIYSVNLPESLKTIWSSHTNSYQMTDIPIDQQSDAFISFLLEQ